jgi:hypothetical protein
MQVVKGGVEALLAAFNAKTTLSQRARDRWRRRPSRAR